MEIIHYLRLIGIFMWLVPALMTAPALYRTARGTTTDRDPLITLIGLTSFVSAMFNICALAGRPDMIIITLVSLSIALAGYAAYLIRKYEKAK